MEPIQHALKRPTRGRPPQQPMVTINMLIPEKIKYALDVLMYQEARSLRREMVLVLLREAMRARGVLDVNDNFIGQRQAVQEAAPDPG